MRAAAAATVATVAASSAPDMKKAAAGVMPAAAVLTRGQMSRVASSARPRWYAASRDASSAFS
jgi:hypothetical protein